MSRGRLLSRREYCALEEAIQADPRGRAFLRQRDHEARLIAVRQVRRMLKHYLAPAAQAAGDPRAERLRVLRQELQEMSVYILQTRREIAALHPDGGDNRIISATGELGAIVSATERATTEILKGAERIQAAAARLPNTEPNDPIRGEIEGQVIDIMMACSFQDITGQRTSKVVNTLRYIEKRVNSLIAIWDRGATPEPEQVADPGPDSHLLNGPPLAGGIGQDDVDAILARTA
jgi:hypothetical protein